MTLTSLCTYALSIPSNCSIAYCTDWIERGQRRRENEKRAYFSQVMGNGEGGIWWQDDIGLDDVRLASMVNREVLDANDERREASEKVGDPL